MRLRPYAKGFPFSYLFGSWHLREASMMGPILQMGKLGCRGAWSQSEHGLSCVELQPRQYLHLCPDLDIMGGDSVKFCKMSELLSRSCIYSTWVLTITQTNSWESIAKLRPHGDSFNEKRASRKGRSVLIVCVRLDVADYKWASLQPGKRGAPPTPPPHVQLHH